MDPNLRRKKAPPLPKFQDQAPATDKINAKVADFLNQIEMSSSSPSHQAPQPLLSLQSQPKAPQLKPVVVDKKKLNMASLNSKLNSIIGAKKIDLNKVVVNTKKAEVEQPKQRRDIELEYDPAHPNSYDQSKMLYQQVLSKLSYLPVNRQEEEDNQILSRLIAQYEIDGEWVEQEVEEPVNQAPYLEEKQKIALRMMQKFGYKVGEGLGKDAQGIRTPLTIKKITNSSCTIEPSSMPWTNFITKEQAAENALLAFKIETSPVVVLLMQLKLEELTEQIQSQVRVECEKNGNIEEWIAFCLNGSIRLFCRFQTVESAFSAFCSINGRYYDEKVIQVHFYPPEKFQAKDLAADLHLPISL